MRKETVEGIKINVSYQIYFSFYFLKILHGKWLTYEPAVSSN